MNQTLPNLTAKKGNLVSCKLKGRKIRLLLGICFLLAGCFLPSGVQAQVIADNYTFTASTGTFDPLTAGATRVPDIESINIISGAIPIGFTFNFNEFDYTHVYVCSRGFISFSPSAYNYAGNDLDNTPSNNRPLIAPLWDNLDGRATGGSRASYETTGLPGSRVFTFEWNKWEWNASSTNPVMSFQVKLYEGSNKIEFIYRQEAGAAVSPSASIGLAGYTTSPGDFVSINNAGVASFSTESFVTSKPATGQIYTFNRIRFPLDVSATALVAPLEEGCFGPNETVQVTFKNVSNAPLDLALNPVTIHASATLGTTTTTLPPTIVNTGVLAQDASRTITLNNTLNMSTAGTYTINASATVAGDGRTRNDAIQPVTRTLTQRHVPGSAALPQDIDFAVFNGANFHTVYLGWSEMSGTKPDFFYSTWTDQNFANNPIHPNGKAARVNMSYAFTTNAWLVSPKFTVGPTHKVVFDLALTGNSTTGATALGSDDLFKVMISTDCGVTYTPIRTFNASTPISSGGQVEVVDLAPYIGQSVIIGFYATTGNVIDIISNDLFIDNILIGTPPPLDMGATALVTPVATGCYQASEPVVVTVKNFANGPIDFAVRPVIVSATVTGAANTILSATLNSGTLAAGAIQNVTVGNLNMSAAGTYSISGRTFLTRDLEAANNSFSAVTRTVKPVVTLPQSVDFSNFTGSNLAAWFPNWSEAAGIPPTGATSDWTNDDFANVTGSTNGTAARIQLSGTSDKAWILGPKITPLATTKLKFELALTAAGTTNGAVMGSDDEFKVLISTDCGVTYTPIRTYNASTPFSNSGQTETVDLAPYSGQKIIVAFYATAGTVSDPQINDLFLDNIFIGTPPPLDLAAIAFVSPTANACYSPTQTVSISLKNLGTSPIDFSVNPATVTVNITGASTQTLNFTINTGTLAPGAAQNVIIGNANFGNAGTYNFSGFVVMTGDGNPANNNLPAVSVLNSTITFFPHFQTFELFTPIGSAAAGNSSWTGGSTGFSWKTGEGVTSASSGPAADHTVGDATGNYIHTDASVGVAGNVAELLSPCFDLHGQTGIGLEFWYFMHGAALDTLHVDVFNGISWVNNVWVKAGPQQTSATDTWKRGFINLTPFNNNFIKIRFRAGRGTGVAGNIAIDDLYFYQIAPVELELTTLTLPNSSCGLTSTETICVTITNNGSSTANAIPVSYSINGGAAVTETINITLAPAATTQYCFTTRANLSTATFYSISGTVNATNDMDANNNTLTGSVISVPTITAYPYVQNFETWSGGWRSDGTNTSWALGTPAATLINTAASGSKAWVTNLTGNHNHNEKSSVLGPCFNFSGIANPAISLKIWRDMEDKKDGAVLQSSIDGGTTWQVIGNFGDPNNWYNRDSIAANPGNQPASANGRFVGWSGTGTGWVTATHALTGLGGQPNVLLRITFASNGSVAKEGFAFDDMEVFNIVAVPTVTAGGPTTFCQGGSVTLTAVSATLGVSYTWQLNGTNISGATGNTYAATAGGSYSAVATLSGSATSTAFAVTVNPTPNTPVISQNGGILTSSAATGNQWYLNGTAIPGATGQSYTTTANGAYTVVTTDPNGCVSAISAALNITPTGFAADISDPNIAVYPNPNSGQFAVKLTGYQKNAIIGLYNLTGQLIRSQEIKITSHETVTQMQLENLAAGTYLLKVTSENNVKVTRLIVQ
jgi:hypothetical protein